MKTDNRLSRQLLLIIFAIIFIIFYLLGVLLPKQMLPIYEKNIYNYLRQPLEFIDEDVSNIKTQEVGYMYIYDGNVLVSDNFSDVVDSTNISDIVRKIDEKYGKFIYNKKTYYYYTNTSNAITRISITNDNYIKMSRIDALHNFFPIILITVIFISLVLIFWALSIVKKIEFLKL